jgi:hypothetical protein
MLTKTKCSFRIVTVLLAALVLVLQFENHAQGNLTVYEKPGGGTTEQSTQSNDNSFIYIAGGLLIAGILAYALVFNKDSKVKPDTTAYLNSGLIYSEANVFESGETELQRVKESITVDIIWGIRNDEALLNEKTYLLGVRIKL